MAEIIYRFDNTVFGGSQNFTLTPPDMPDWHPYGEEVKENIFTGYRGNKWRYQWYRKERVELGFNGVATSVAATMGSIAKEHVNFLWFKDLLNAGGTGTMIYLGEFSFSPVSPNVCDFSFLMTET